jgi:hypothetical protein
MDLKVGGRMFLEKMDDYTIFNSVLGAIGAVNGRIDMKFPVVLEE